MSIPTDQSTVLAAVVARLRSHVAELSNESACFVSDFAYPPPQRKGNLFATVAPTDGKFDEEMQIGGGIHQVVEYSGVVVTVYSDMKLDATGRIEHLLSHAERGLLPLKQKILKALASHRLVDEEGNELLVAYMHAGKSSAPRFDEELKMGVFALHFHCDFEWELT